MIRLSSNYSSYLSLLLFLRMISHASSSHDFSYFALFLILPMIPLPFLDSYPWFLLFFLIILAFYDLKIFHNIFPWFYFTLMILLTLFGLFPVPECPVSFQDSSPFHRERQHEQTVFAASTANKICQSFIAWGIVNEYFRSNLVKSVSSFKLTTCLM